MRRKPAVRALGPSWRAPGPANEPQRSIYVVAGVPSALGGGALRVAGSGTIDEETSTSSKAAAGANMVPMQRTRVSGSGPSAAFVKDRADVVERLVPKFRSLDGADKLRFDSKDAPGRRYAGQPSPC